jgi:hypothetical protein
MATKANGGGGRMPIYKSYVFRTKDPVIDELRTLAEDTYGARVNGKVLSEISQEGGPSTSCMRAWFFGTTKRPTSATVEAAGRSMGFKRVWQKMREEK